MALRAAAPAATLRVAGRRQALVASRRAPRSAFRVEAAKRSVGDLSKADLEGKRVFVRCDLNVPLDKELNITDDTRIRAAVDTLKYLSDNGAKVIVTSHLVGFLVFGFLFSRGGSALPISRRLFFSSLLPRFCLAHPNCPLLPTDDDLPPLMTPQGRPKSGPEDK